jgi:hypothetical protein
MFKMAQTMANTDYRVVHTKDSAYGVRIIEPNVAPLTIGGFESELEANVFISKQRWMASATNE